MKKLILLFSLFACITANAQIKLSQPDASHIQIINGSNTTSFFNTSIRVAIDTISVPSQVAIYQAGSITASYGSSPYNAFYINGVMATSAQQIAAQIRAWQPASSGGGGGSANPYPGSDYSTSVLQVTGNTALSALNTKSKPLITRTVSSVTVTTSATTLTTANASGYRALIQLPSTATGSIWILVGTGSPTTAPPCLEIKPGGTYTTSGEYPDTQAITAISTVSQAVTVITY